MGLMSAKIYNDGGHYIAIPQYPKWGRSRRTRTKEKEILDEENVADMPSVPAGLEAADSKDIIDFLFDFFLFNK